MSTRRESWYHCTFTFESTEHQITAAVHAWSPEAAGAQFAAMVRDVTADSGKVRVEPGLGPAPRRRSRSSTAGPARASERAHCG